VSWLDKKQHETENHPVVTPPPDIVRYAAWVIAIVSTLIWINTRDSEHPSALGPAMLWTGLLFTLLFGYNRRLFRFRLTWALSMAMILIHGMILKLTLPILLNMNAWMIGAILIPELLIMEIPFAWIEKRNEP
jgi:hypothetical protein